MQIDDERKVTSSIIIIVLASGIPEQKTNYMNAKNNSRTYTTYFDRKKEHRFKFKKKSISFTPDITDVH